MGHDNDQAPGAVRLKCYLTTASNSNGWVGPSVYVHIDLHFRAYNYRDSYSIGPLPYLWSSARHWARWPTPVTISPQSWQRSLSPASLRQFASSADLCQNAKGRQLPV